MVTLSRFARVHPDDLTQRQTYGSFTWLSFSTLASACQAGPKNNTQPPAPTPRNTTTDTQTNRQTGRQAGRQRKKESKQAGRQARKQGSKQVGRQANIYLHIHTVRHTHTSSMAVAKQSVHVGRQDAHANPSFMASRHHVLRFSDRAEGNPLQQRQCRNMPDKNPSTPPQTVSDLSDVESPMSGWQITIKITIKWAALAGKLLVRRNDRRIAPVLRVTMDLCDGQQFGLRITGQHVSDDLGGSL